MHPCLLKQLFAVQQSQGQGSTTMQQTCHSVAATAWFPSPKGPPPSIRLNKWGANQASEALTPHRAGGVALSVLLLMEKPCRSRRRDSLYKKKERKSQLFQGGVRACSALVSERRLQNWMELIKRFKMKLESLWHQRASDYHNYFTAAHKERCAHQGR